MSNLVAFETSKVPAHIKTKAVANAFAAVKGGGGYPVISIKGKVFHIVRGDERELVHQPDDPDTPAAALEVVILSANPHKSKVYYSGGFEEGSNAKPECYSNDGVAPAADAANPQAKKCATCPHSVYGSKITDNGKKAKACADSLRLAVAPAGQVNDPMLLRVPAGSFNALANFGDLLSKRGAEPHHVVTKIGFDYSVAHPALTFKPFGWVPAEVFATVEETKDSDVVKQITGVVAVEAEEGDEFSNTPAPAHVAPKAEPKAAKPAAPKAVAKPAPADDLPAEPKTKVKVETATVADSTDDLDFDD